MSVLQITVKSIYRNAYMHFVARETLNSSTGKVLFMNYAMPERISLRFESFLGKFDPIPLQEWEEN